MIWIPGPAGQLEGLLDSPESDRGTHAALFCHPHSQYGGTMHNKVVYAAAQAARDLGLPVLRFNFRGVGRSAGRFDGGPGEIADARSALDQLDAAYPGRALVAGGVSFGAWVASVMGGADQRVVALISIATAIAIHGADYLDAITKPALFVQASNDELGPADDLAAVVRAYRGPARLVKVEGTSHLFPGQTERVQAAVRDFLHDVMGSSPAEWVTRRPR